MKNCKTSAGTAAQKRSKSSLLARCALILAIPMLSAVCLSGCEIFAVVDASKPIIIESKVSLDRYRARYNYGKYFMEVVSKDSLKNGDTLWLSNSR